MNDSYTSEKRTIQDLLDCGEELTVWVLTVMEWDCDETRIIEQQVYSQGEVAGLRAKEFEGPNRSIDLRSVPVWTVRG
jgi:hypothetical protein